MKVKLAIFDVDGVLVPVRSSWNYIHERLGVADEAERVKEMFVSGGIDYVKWLELDTRLWINARGGKLHKRELLEILSDIEINKEAPQVFRWLRKRGVRVAMVSGGVDLLVSRIAETLGADIWLANKLSFDKKGYLVPGGLPLVGVWKDRAVKLIVNELGISLSETAFIGDSEWDAPAMAIVGYPISYGPHSEALKGVAKYHVNRLVELIDLIENIERESTH